jgi:hypothetical protein
MKRIARTLSRSLKAALSGLERAHEGELLGRSAKAAALGGRQAAHRPATPPDTSARLAAVPRTRRVVLAVDDAVRPEATRYALEACDRLKADLVVMAEPGDTATETAIRRSIESLRPRGLGLSFIGCHTDLLCCVRRYVAAHADVLFVVASDADGFAEDLSVQVGGPAARGANVPWVVVSRGAAGGNVARHHHVSAA